MFNNNEKFNGRKNDGAHDVAFDEANQMVDAHYSKLHDEDVDATGNSIDLATGEKYDNSTEGHGIENLGQMSKLPKELEKSAEDLVEEYYKKHPHLRPKD